MKMSDAEKKKYLKEMKDYMKKVTSSKEEAQAFLQKTGIYTKTGDLKPDYK